MAQDKVFMALVSNDKMLANRPGLSFRNHKDIAVDGFHSDLIASPDRLMTLAEAEAVFDVASKNTVYRAQIATMKEGAYIPAGYRSLGCDMYIVRLPQEDIEYYERRRALTASVAVIRQKMDDLIPKQLRDELKEAEKALRKHKKM